MQRSILLQVYHETKLLEINLFILRITWPKVIYNLSGSLGPVPSHPVPGPSWDFPGRDSPAGKPIAYYHCPQTDHLAALNQLKDITT